MANSFTYRLLLGLECFFELADSISGIAQNLLYFHLMIAIKLLDLKRMILVLCVQMINDFRQLRNLFTHFVMQVRKHFQASLASFSGCPRWTLRRHCSTADKYVDLAFTVLALTAVCRQESDK